MTSSTKKTCSSSPPFRIFRKSRPACTNFIWTPDKAPLTTPTGKLEFTSTDIEKHFPDDEERPPYPKWVEKSPLHDERLGGARAKKYPLLCMSNHGRWRFHANLDDITWNREVETMKLRGKDGYQYEPAWLNPSRLKSAASSSAISSRSSTNAAPSCARRT